MPGRTPGFKWSPGFLSKIPEFSGIEPMRPRHHLLPVRVPTTAMSIVRINGDFLLTGEVVIGAEDSRRWTDDVPQPDGDQRRTAYPRRKVEVVKVT